MGNLFSELPYRRIGHRKGERSYLVFRYSRTRDGKVIFYGRIQPGVDLNFAELERRSDRIWLGWFADSVRPAEPRPAAEQIQVRSTICLRQPLTRSSLIS